MNENPGLISVTDENNNKIEIQVIFGFGIPEYKKSYVVYTTECQSPQEEINVNISEYDNNTYEIKSIPEDELDFVMESYNNAKSMILETE